MAKRRDLSDPESIAKFEEKARLIRQRELEALTAVLKSPEGRAFLWGLIGKCRVFQSVWDQSSRIHYLVGRQELGQDILHDVMEINPEAFTLMKAEANQFEESLDA